MSALNIGTQIPSAINTVEQLAVWAGLFLAWANPKNDVKEDRDRVEYVASCALFRDAGGQSRMVIRLSIPMDEAYASDGANKLWTFAEELSGVSLSTDFTEN